MAFDYVIVGAGPAGLALATFLSDSYSVAVIERERTIGGCHRVRRDDDGNFSEHGPRVYSGCYLTLNALLERIGTSWDETFVPATFSPHYIDGSSFLGHFGAREFTAFTCEYMKMAILGHANVDESVLQFARRWNFSESTKTYLDLVCRFSDGAGSDRYRVYEFLQGFEQHVLYRFFEPRVPNDKHLFPVWRRYLEKKGVALLTGTRVTRTATGKVYLDDGRVISASRGTVLAIPPEHAVPVLRRSALLPSGFAEFARHTAYEEYASVTLFFSSKDVLGTDIVSTPWGIVWIDMSRTTHFEEFAAGSVVSAAATLLDVKSPRLAKTANECTRQEIADEILHQVSAAHGKHLPVVRTIVSGGLHKKKKDGTWEDSDGAFVAAAGRGYWPDFKISPGLYTLGCHTGHSSNHFTSMESAIQNAVALAHVLDPSSAASIVPSTTATRLALLCCVLLAALSACTHRE